MTLPPSTKTFKAWRRGVEGHMSWDLDNFWKEWQTEEGTPAYAEALDELMAKHEAIQKEIEEEAVKIGL